MVVLNTEVTDELLREGIAKDLIRTIQNQRKEIDCEYIERIVVAVDTSDDEVTRAIDEHRELICGETLADELTIGKLDDAERASSEHGEVYVAKVSA